MMGGSRAGSTLCPPQAGPTGMPAGPGGERAEGGGDLAVVGAQLPPNAVPCRLQLIVVSRRGVHRRRHCRHRCHPHCPPRHCAQGEECRMTRTNIICLPIIITKKMGCCHNFGLIRPLLLSRGYTNKKTALSRPPSGCPRGWDKAVSRRIRYMASEFGARVSLLVTGSCGQNRHKGTNCASFRSTSEVEH